MHNTQDQLDNKYYKAGMKSVADDHSAFYDSHIKFSIDAKLGREAEGFLEFESGTDKLLRE
ncbi:hypothetical protein MBAV_005874 [Candidatus Magnetobacterium bavaricum]|uniref:Uncharacterized protein n=1 Tax=Candidatus Magnetobacterium bavaricum TaxID=29290 RepID=A0A0F3GMN4_9BACT|nr:hypothetical protein MBAV_005874 [Candidatus Magnetobacterium bavaricum]